MEAGSKLPAFFINMIYDKQILHILSEVGDSGISVQNLARHVYNMNCSLFALVDKDEIHKYVQQFLLKNSKSVQSIIESTGRRGYYRLNTSNSADAYQLMLSFREEKQEDVKELKTEKDDYSLSLFD